MKEVTAAADPPSMPPAGPDMAVSAPDGGPAELVLAGEIGAECLRELEERLATPPLREATVWLVDMSGFTRFGLGECLRAAAGGHAAAKARGTKNHGARPAVQRTLRDTGSMQSP